MSLVKEIETKALLHTHQKGVKELVDQMKDHEALRNDLALASQVIDSLNQQVNDLLDSNWDVEIQQIKKACTGWIGHIHR